MKCLILAAGYATRLYPLTENFPKPLLEIKNKPIINWLIDDLEETKVIDEYIVISNHKFISHFLNWQNKQKNKEKITIIDDMSISNDTRLGAVNDIALAIKEKNINDDLLVLAGDNVLDFSLRTFINYFKIKKHTCIMRYYEEKKEKIKKSACVLCDSSDLVLEMIEKPILPNSNWCCPPFYIYAKEDVKRVFDALNDGCAKDAPGSYINWLYQKNKVYAMKMPGKRYDIGTLESYKAVNETYKGINN